MGENGNNGAHRVPTNRNIRAAIREAADELGVAEAASGEDVSSADLVSEIVRMVGGDGGGNVKKAARRSTWIIGLLVALFGSGGIVASYYVTEARSKTNADAIKAHSAMDMHPAAVRRVEKIEADVKATRDDVKDIKTQQTAVIGGIEQLKKEAQTEKQKRLQEELERLRRELRRRR